jgi:hypothetical protein
MRTKAFAADQATATRPGRSPSASGDPAMAHGKTALQSDHAGFDLGVGRL